MVDGKLLIEKLLTYAKKFLHLNEMDEVCERNLLLAQFKLKEPLAEKVNLDYISKMSVPDLLVNEIMDYSRENGIAEDEVQANIFAQFIFGLLTPKPYELNREIKYLLETSGPKSATDNFYDICVKNGYIQRTAIEKNICWVWEDTESEGESKNYLEITINLSKPEKDNKDIMKLVQSPTPTKYPKCPLCRENEGYMGTYTHPPRSNLRLISLTLGKKEEWYLQYSPYGYYEEHCIVLNKKHSNMIMTRDTINKLMDFVDLFPNYFVGSNSDLPIVGGSILNHEHYQGGAHIMPMHNAKPKKRLYHNNYPDVEISILDWYNSVVRLSGNNRESVAKLGGDIIEGWKTYSDESVGIVNTKTDRKNSCTPIVRKIDDTKYVLEIILRNNNTTDEFPDGVFHAHPEHHNIKKEGIGLIEAMGRFILPGRLRSELDKVADYLCAGPRAFNESKIGEKDPMFKHKTMIKTLMQANPNIKNKEEALRAVKEYVNLTCRRILENTAVFKQDKKNSGLLKFLAFLKTLGIQAKD